MSAEQQEKDRHLSRKRWLWFFLVLFAPGVLTSVLTAAKAGADFGVLAAFTSIPGSLYAGHILKRLLFKQSKRTTTIIAFLCLAFGCFVVSFGLCFFGCAAAGGTIDVR